MSYSTRTMLRPCKDNRYYPIVLHACMCASTGEFIITNSGMNTIKLATISSAIQRTMPRRVGDMQRQFYSYMLAQASLSSRMNEYNQDYQVSHH